MDVSRGSEEMAEYTVTRHSQCNALSGKKFKTLTNARKYQKENGGTVWSVKRETDPTGWYDVTHPQKRNKKR